MRAHKDLSHVLHLFKSRKVSNLWYATVSKIGITNAGIGNEICNDNGTSGDPSDDYIRFDLDSIGSGLGTGYSLSVNNGGSFAGSNTGTYGAPASFRLQDVSARIITYTITDNGSMECTIQFNVLQAPCVSCGARAGTLSGLINI